MKKMQKARAEALEAALGALSAGVGRDVAWTAEPEEVLQYAKFILGKPAKKKRRKGGVRGRVRAYVAKKGTPLPESLEDLEAKGWKPLGYLAEDDLKEDPSFSVAGVFRKPPAATVPGPPPIAGKPATITLEEVRKNLDSTEADEQFPPASPVGEDPGDQGVLTQWAEAIRQQDAAREAAREARDLEVDPEEEEEKEEAEKALRDDLSVKPAPMFHSAAASEKAPDHVVRQGAEVGCPECSAEQERRAKRDESLEEGRRKLAERLDATTGRSGDLDEDELLAVAGSEVYPPNDEEPSRELKIRNRKGEVRTWKSGGAQEGHGWTASPEDPWGLRYSWTSLEMSRRGPWHVV